MPTEGAKNEAICSHINAIQVLTRQVVLCVVMLTEDEDIVLLTPAAHHQDVLAVLSLVDWRQKLR